MVLGADLPEPPTITARDLLRARLSLHPIVRVQLFDLSGVLRPHRRRILDAIEAGVDAVSRAGADLRASLGMPPFYTHASYATSEPDRRQKGKQLPLDYPVYALPWQRKRPDADRRGVVMMRRIMTEHGVPKRSQEIAISEWTERRLYGVCAPPMRSYHQTVFLDSDQLDRDVKNDAYFLSNAILHELGHAFNVVGGLKYAHPHDASLMQPGLPPNTGRVDYNAKHVQHIVVRINNAWREEVSQLKQQ